VPRTFYKLDADGQPTPTRDVHEWATWIATADPVVAHDRGSRVEVLTVFLGLDYNGDAAGAPMLFETLVVGGSQHGAVCRYATRAAAVAGHRAMCARALGAVTP